MAKEETIQMQGEILEMLPNATFRVKLKMAMWFWVTLLGKCGFTRFANCQVAQ